MVNMLSLTIFFSWFLGISILCISHFSMSSDFLYDKLGIRTYYYRSKTTNVDKNFTSKPLFFNKGKYVYEEKLFTDVAWLILVGFILPFVLLLMILPLYLLGHISFYLLTPFILWLYNSFMILIRKRLNTYDELSELESPYIHRYIPITLFYGILISLSFFIVVICYLSIDLWWYKLPILIICLIFLVLDHIFLFLDKLNKKLKHDLRSDEYFIKLSKYTLLLVSLLLIMVIGYCFMLYGFDYTFQSYINEHSKSKLYENNILK